ncbi:MAG: reprolysin-like metallopeptidase [Luteibacter sp.]
MSRTSLFLALCFGLATLPAHATAAALAHPGEAALARKLARLPHDASRGARVTLPTGKDTWSTFTVRDSLTLPAALARKFPGLRSFRGEDDQGRTVRLDLSTGGVRASIRDGATEWLVRPGELVPAPPVEPADPASVVRRRALGATTPADNGGGVRYDFRLAIAASSTYVAAAGGTVESALAEIVHAVNRANDVFETDVGVHFTLVANNERLIRAKRSRDPFARIEPGPASVELIEREIGKRHYDVGHALTTFYGGVSETGTSCSDDRSADFLAGHKAAAWSGHPRPATSPDAVAFLIHVLARQIGAWPTANGCERSTLDDRGFEPGSGSTVMGFAPSGCGGVAQQLQAHSDLYLHAANIAQIRGWLGSLGGRCATKRTLRSTAPWIDPLPLAEETIVPARTPFVLEAHARASDGRKHLTYTWEQMDAGLEQRGSLMDDGEGPLFRSFAPTTSARRTFPRMAAVLGHESAEPGEALPVRARRLTFRVTARDNAGGVAATSSADTRVRVVDTGRAFALTSPVATTRATAGLPLTVTWDAAGTREAPLYCHSASIDLSVDGGKTWLADPLARGEANDGEAVITVPAGIATTDRARLRLRCESRPFFAVSPGDFHISGTTPD